MVVGGMSSKKLYNATRSPLPPFRLPTTVIQSVMSNSGAVKATLYTFDGKYLITFQLSRPTYCVVGLTQPSVL